MPGWAWWAIEKSLDVIQKVVLWKRQNPPLELYTLDLGSIGRALAYCAEALDSIPCAKVGHGSVHLSVETEAGQSGVKGHLHLHSELEAGLSYTRDTAMKSKGQNRTTKPKEINAQASGSLMLPTHSLHAEPHRLTLTSRITR